MLPLWIGRYVLLHCCCTAVVPSDTSFLRTLQLAAKVFFIVLLYRMSLSCGISTRRLAAVMVWSVRAAPLLLYCCCTAVMVGCDRPTRSVPSLSDRSVPAFLSYRVRVVLFVLPSSGRSPPSRLATSSFFSVNRSCLATPPSFGHCCGKSFLHRTSVPYESQLRYKYPSTRGRYGLVGMCCSTAVVLL